MMCLLQSNDMPWPSLQVCKQGRPLLPLSLILHPVAATITVFFGGGGVQGKTITDWLFPLWQAMTGYLPVVSVTQFVSGRHTI